MIVGYARVSTEGQAFEAQADALKAAGAEKVFAEKISGAKAIRPQLDKALRELGSGDVLIVTRLDRLGRSTADLLSILDRLTKAGVGFRSLAEAWADTTTAHGRLMVTFFAGMAEFERDLIRQRTQEGRQHAKRMGRKLGPNFKLSAHQRAEALQAMKDGTATQAELARRYNVNRSAMTRLAKSMP